MNWNAFVDNYCERLLPGFWDEPLNAVSNIAFWLAAWLVWRRWQRWQRSVFTNVQPEAASGSADIKSLLVMLLLIGAASFAFHTLATRWAGGLDVLFIALFLHFYLAVYMHRAMGLRWRVAWLGIPLFFAASLSLRQLDMPLCSDWRWGTHFAWHALNAVTLGFTSWAVVQLHLAERTAD